MHHKWSTSEKMYLKEIVKNRSHKDITQMMNDRFTYQFSVKQIKSAIARYGLNTGRKGYEKGRVPHNKGMKGIHRSPKTEFKKGHIPQNSRDIGSERIDKRDGCVYVKVSKNKWQCKHRIIWEKANGKIPDGCVVIFKDGNKRNFDINNLAVLTRAQHVKMCKNNMYHQNAELTEIGISITSISEKIRERVENG